MTVKKITFLFLATCITLWRCFSFDWNAPIERWDEKTNIDVIEETSKKTFLGYPEYNNRPFFEKPPLWYMVGSALKNPKLPTLQTMRLTSAFFGFLTIIIVFVFTTKWYGYIAGSISLFVLLSTSHLFTKNPGMIFSTHTFHSADSDSLFVLLLTIAGISSISIGTSIYSSLVTGISIALALVTKSPLALVPLISITCVTLLYRHPTMKKHLVITWSIVVSLYTLWVLYAYILFGQQFISEYIGYHIVYRTMTPIEGHGQPLFFYISLLFSKKVYLFFELYILGCIYSIKHKKQHMHLVITVTSCLYILIPSLSQTKLSWYILPFYPISAIVIARLYAYTIDAFRIFSEKNV